MKLDRRSLLAALLLTAFVTPAVAAPNLKNEVYLDTKYGRATILLRPDLAPKAVKQIETLTKQGFYNGLVFHRVIAGFMAQTGDPTGTGTGGSKLPDLPAEFTTKAHFVRGTVGMARTSDPNSANSQFFICYAPAPFLDGKYTIVGQVISGMGAIDKIKKGQGESGMVVNPDHILKMQMASDAAKSSH
jgi:peptidylprolyl isomerase